MNTSDISSNNKGNLKLFGVIVAAVIVALVAFTIGKSAWVNHEAAAAKAEQQMQEQQAQSYVQDFMASATTAYYQAKGLPVYPQDKADGFPAPRIVSPGTWRPDATLHAIIASPWHSASEWPYFAFFFVNGNLVADAYFSTAPTVGTLQDNNTIAIDYGFYKKGDPKCCPSGKATERFQWDGAKLVMLDLFQRDYDYDSNTAQSLSSFMQLSPVNS